MTQAANLFRALGVGEGDVVAYVLPNALETAVTLLGGAVAGIVNPINPLLEPEQISAILRETKAKVVVTLKAFPKTDLAQKVAEAVRHAPRRENRAGGRSERLSHPAEKLDRAVHAPEIPAASQRQRQELRRRMRQTFRRPAGLRGPHRDHIAAYFHTGGTTGMPKVAQHRAQGMIYNGWLGARLLFRETDMVMCPLPLFHVFAAYPILMSMIGSGAHVIFPTPAGYRGEGVIDNLWKLIERWKVTYLVTVPTALSALLQRPVNADVKTLRGAFSGSAPLPIELFNRFEKITGVQIVEGYGLTECTCLVSVNPPEGDKKIGSVGLPFPYTDVRIVATNPDGSPRLCGIDEVGEICVSNPGVYAGNTYTEADKNKNLYHDGNYLRTGDLGRHRRRRLSLHHRARQGSDHPRRPQHRPRRDRRGADGLRRRRFCRRHRPARRPCRRTALRLCRTRQRRHADRRRRCTPMPDTISTNARRCRNISRSCPNCRKPPSAKCSNPICAAAPSSGCLTRPWPRRGLPRG